MPTRAGHIEAATPRCQANWPDAFARQASTNFGLGGGTLVRATIVMRLCLRAHALPGVRQHFGLRLRRRVVRTAAGGARRGVPRRVQLRGGGVRYWISEQLVRGSEHAGGGVRHRARDDYRRLAVART